MKRHLLQLTSCLGLGLAFYSLAQADKIDSADTLFKAGKWQQAREAFEAALPGLKENDAAYALWRIGYTWQVQHQHEKAVPYFRRVLAIEGIDAEHISGAWLRLGYSLRLLGKGQEGIAALEKAAAVDGAPANHVAEGLLYAAWEHNGRKECEPAMAKFRRIEAIAATRLQRGHPADGRRFSSGCSGMGHSSGIPARPVRGRLSLCARIQQKEQTNELASLTYST